MSDTTLQNCKCCELEDDCINGLCQSCSTYNYKLQAKYATLKASHDKLKDACGRALLMYEQLYGCTNPHEEMDAKGEACDICREWEFIKQALAEAEKIK